MRSQSAAWSPPSSPARDPLPDEARLAPRFPRPSRLDSSWSCPGEKAAKAAREARAGDASARCSSTSRATAGRRARSAELAPDEIATVVVEVRSITSRPGAAARDEAARRGARRRRDGDDDGRRSSTSRGCERRYRPGTRLLLTGKYQAAQRGFRVIEHAETGELVATGEDMATYPASTGCRRSRSRRWCTSTAATARDVLEPLPARLRVLERLPDRWAALDAAHFGDQEGGRRRLAFDEFLLLQIALLRRRSRRREGARAARARAAGRADRALAARTRCRSRRPATSARAMAAVDDDVARRPADAAAADGRGRLGQDRRRALRDAARRRVGRPGGADGADRDARRAALRRRCRS